MKPLKIASIGLGAVIGVAHIGILGHLVSRKQVVQPPAINFPSGRYSSYKVEVDKDGYTIEYKANDPKTLTSERSLDLVENKKGIFGGKDVDKTEYRRDEYTAEGFRNTGGGAVGEGKSASDIECIVADAGARSQGAMAGTSIAAGVAVPVVSSIPYIGWLASGWALLLGQNLGSEAGSQVNSIISDC